MSTDPLWSPGRARSDRFSLELSLREQTAEVMQRFLGEVYFEAAQPGVVLASALPGSFSISTVRAAWNRVTSKTPSQVTLSTEVADQVFGAVRAVLAKPFPTMAAKRSALDRALSYDSAPQWQAVAERQARSLATRQFGQAQLSRMQAAGVPAKRWISTHDPHTRATHRAADRQTVPLHVAFTVGGELLQYPGDPAATPDLTENCRCVPVAAKLPR